LFLRLAIDIASKIILIGSRGPIYRYLRNYARK